VLLPSSFINASAKDAFLAGLEEPFIVDGNGGAAGLIMTEVTETGTPEYFPDFQGKIAVSQMLKGGAEQTAWHGVYKLIISVGEGGIVSLVGMSRLIEQSSTKNHDCRVLARLCDGSSSRPCM
jgi:hypothetical protein